jgi:hypothetical protein
MKRRRPRSPKRHARATRAHTHSWLQPLKARPPAPFFDAGGAALASPETALLCAVLEDAFACLDDAQHPELKADARHWFFSGPSRSVFSFLSLCEALDLDAAYIRETLRARLNARAATAARKTALTGAATVKWPGSAPRPFGGK